MAEEDYASSSSPKLGSKRQCDAESMDETEGVIEAREQLYASLEERCRANHRNMCLIECREVSGKIALVLTKPKGKLWTYMGVNVAGERHLFPEEVLFLMSMCAAKLHRDGVPLNMCQAFQLLLGHDPALWNRHMVYDHLRRAGYIVVRRHVPLVPNSNSSTPDSSVDEQSFTENDNSRQSLEPIYDVHLTDCGYTFRSKRKPHLRVLVLSADEEVPSAEDLAEMQTRLDDDCPFHIACVDGSSISFFNMRAVRTVDVTEEYVAVEREKGEESESD